MRGEQQGSCPARYGMLNRKPQTEFIALLKCRPSSSMKQTRPKGPIKIKAVKAIEAQKPNSTGPIITHARRSHQKGGKKEGDVESFETQIAANGSGLTRHVEGNGHKNLSVPLLHGYYEVLVSY
ncbi:hypothetical protein Bca4012_032248 [Brassica carinata]